MLLSENVFDKRGFTRTEVSSENGQGYALIVSN